MADWTMEFGAYALKIGGMTGEKALVPAEKPFTTRGDVDSDFFKPVRTGSGTIRVICRMGELDEVTNRKKVTDHPVTLTLMGFPLWLGYVQQDVFTQPYQNGMVEMEIPVCDVLEAAGGVYPQECMEMPTVGEVLEQFLVDMGMLTNIRTVSITTRTPVSVLKHRIDFRSTYWYEEKGRCKEAWATIIGDICKLYGWQAMVMGRTLYLLSMDYANATVREVASSSLTSSNPYAPQTSLPNYDANELIPQGEHKTSVYQGKKGVSVKGTVGEYEKEIFKLDWDRFNTSSYGVLYGLTYYAKAATDSTYMTLYQQAVETNSDPQEFGIFQAQYKQAVTGQVPSGQRAASLYWGASAGMVGKQLTKSYYEGQVQFAEYVWSKGVYLASGSGSSYSRCLRIKSEGITIYDNKMYLNITGIIKICAKRDLGNLLKDGTWQGKGGGLFCKIKFGNKWLIDGGIGLTWSDYEEYASLWFDDSGSIFGNRDVGSGIGNPMEELPNGFLAKMPTGTGDLTIDIYNIPDYAASIEDLAINIVRPGHPIEKEKVENEESRVMSNGSHDEYTVECPFTTARGLQGGSGVVRGNDYSLLKTLDVTNKSAEASLADRIKDYYKDSYRMYELGVIANMNSASTVRVGGKVYGVVAIDADWRNDYRKLTLIELKAWNNREL